METEIAKRMSWKNDSPATEKQIAYATSLVDRLKAKASNLNTNDNDDKLCVDVLETLILPSNLTKTEASMLISCLRDTSPSGLIQLLGSAIDKRRSGKQLSSTDSSLGLLVFVDAVKIVDEFQAVRTAQIRRDILTNKEPLSTMDDFSRDRYIIQLRKPGKPGDIGECYAKIGDKWQPCQYAGAMINIKDHTVTIKVKDTDGNSYEFVGPELHSNLLRTPKEIEQTIKLMGADLNIDIASQGQKPK